MFLYKKLYVNTNIYLKKKILAVSSNKPIMQIETIISTPEIVLHPSQNEIYKITANSIRNCVEATKKFTRWMAGQHLKTNTLIAILEKLNQFFSPIKKNWLLYK